MQKGTHHEAVPFEPHVFPLGKHGLGLAAEYPDISKWAELAAN